MKKFFLDCEFNGFGGQLISLALVREGGGPGSEFYAVIKYPEGFVYDPWVQAHVLPVLHQLPESKPDAQRRLAEFLQQNSVNNQVAIVADWPEDIKHFCEFMIVAPGRMIMSPNITFEMDRSSLPITADASKVPHNALFDARALAGVV